MSDNSHPPDAGKADSGRAISRREFARRAAIASAVASVAPAVAVTADLDSSPGPQEPKAAASPVATPPPAQGQLPNSPKLSPESQAEADARFQTILVIYGSRFSNEQKNDIHRLCAITQPALDRVRAYKVENGDGTALYLKPQYEREKKPKPAPAKAPAAAAHTAAPAPAAAGKP